jgi:hypothetical protein
MAVEQKQRRPSVTAKSVLLLLSIGLFLQGKIIEIANCYTVQLRVKIEHSF